MSKKNLSYFITIALAISIFFCGWLSGRNQRLSKYNKSDATIKELNSDIIQLKRQLELRIEDTKQLEQQLDTIGIGVDECLGTVRELREINSLITVESNNIAAIVRELKLRIEQYENRITQLEEHLQKLKDSTNKQQG